jgi:hypothetical protein
MKNASSPAKHRHLVLLTVFSAALICTVVTPLQAAPATGVSAPALYNEANAAQRAHRLGPAILSYERARFLAPDDPSILLNLGIARDKAGVSAPAIPRWLRPAHWLSFNGLATLASLAFCLFSMLFFGAARLPGGWLRPARYAAASIGVLILLASTSLALRWGELGRSVIVASAPADARIAPATNAAVSFAVKPGEIVSEVGIYGAFVRIRTDDGQSGWVSAAAVEKIVPSV